MGFRVDTVMLGPDTEQYAGDGQATTDIPSIAAQARRLGMPLNPPYSLAQLQAGAWRALQKSKGSCIDPTRLEASLSEEAFDEAFGMDKAAFARLPSFERKRRKAILMLV